LWGFDRAEVGRVRRRVFVPMALLLRATLSLGTSSICENASAVTLIVYAPGTVMHVPQSRDLDLVAGQ
jgi:hypothetical protein